MTIFSVDYLLPVQLGNEWVGVVFRDAECAIALLDRYDICNKAILCNPSFDVDSIRWFKNSYDRLRIVPDEELVDRFDIKSLKIDTAAPTIEYAEMLPSTSLSDTLSLSSMSSSSATSLPLSSMSSLSATSLPLSPLPSSSMTSSTVSWPLSPPLSPIPTTPIGYQMMLQVFPVADPQILNQQLVPQKMMPQQVYKLENT